MTGTGANGAGDMWYGLQLHGNLDIELYPEIARRAEAYGFADVAVHDAPLRRPCWPLLCDIARATSTVAVAYWARTSIPARERRRRLRGSLPSREARGPPPGTAPPGASSLSR